MNIVQKIITELTSTEPVTVPEAKTHLNITDSGWDAELTGLITQCRKALEDYTGLSFIYKRVLLYADLSGEWTLPYGPLIGIEGVATQESTIGSGIPNYTTLEEGWKVQGDLFTTLNCYRHKITYTVGYTTLPPNLKLALLNEIYFRWENKGQTSGSICDAAIKLANPYRVMAWV